MHPILPNPAKLSVAAACLSLVIVLGGCGAGDEDAGKTADAAGAAPAAEHNPAAALLPDGNGGDDSCEDGGALSTTLYGALAGDVEWYLDQLQCQGMPRPDGAGARLRFSGKVGSDDQVLAFIIAIPDLVAGVDAAELPSNVTVIDQSNSQFFSTPDMDSCWTDVEAQWLMEGSDSRYRIDGVLYCIGPLAEVNGDRSVSIPELSFSGQVDWGTQ